MTGQMIQRFKLEGQFDDGSYLVVKERAILALTGQMKEMGFIPVLDLDYTWHTKWVGDSMEYLLILQGVYVGLEKAWDYAGVINGKPVPSLRKNKSGSS